MKSSIQKEKIVKKLNLLENHILDLVEYNNLKNYQNIKRFIIKIDYHEEISSYNYSINILRGTNKPEKTLTIRFNSEEKINDLIENMIKNITKSKYFSYTSFGMDYTEINKFAINFKNNVSVEFYINDENDLEFYKRINEKYKKNTIISSHLDITLNSELKDELQRIKAIKVINNIDSIFTDIIKLNDIENYENTKPYKLLIKSDYDEENECFLYDFNIIRGSIHPENIVEYSLSIKDNDIVLYELKKLLNKYINSENLIYKSTYKNYNSKNYSINLKKEITIDISNNIEEDIEFFNNLFNVSTKEKKLVYIEE